MATFKVGQRVRKVRDILDSDRWKKPHPKNPHVRLGTEGTVAGEHPAGGYRIAWDGYRSIAPSGVFRALPYMLAPITDPKADEFIERMKKLAREPAPALPISSPVTGLAK